MNRIIHKNLLVMIGAAAVFVASSALADLAWPDTMDSQIAARTASALPSGGNAVYGDSFDTFCGVERYSDGQDFFTTKLGISIVVF